MILINKDKISNIYKRKVEIEKSFSFLASSSKMLEMSQNSFERVKFNVYNIYTHCSGS